VARDEDSDEAKPRGCSPKHGRRQRGSVILEENGVNVSSTLERRRARVSSKAMGGGAVCSGGASPFYTGWGGGGHAVMGGNGQ
jgi:hypothetical protein